MSEKAILHPWYTINDDPLCYEPYTARDSGADMNAHTKAYHRRQELMHKKSLSKQQKRSLIQQKHTNWLMTITMAARKALCGENEYSLDDNSREWLDNQIKSGLNDVFFVYRDWADGILLPGDKVGIVCWYEDGRKLYTTIDVDENEEPFLTERPLYDSGYSKPKMDDNREQFVGVLLKMASYAYNGPTTFWGNQLSRAVAEAKKGNLLEAVELSKIGGGMGSWYDTPMGLMPEMKEINLQLGYEQDYAVLYYVNNC